MSISGEINRIRSEVNTQTDLISQIRSALNGKVAGGGAVIEPILQDKTITENGTYTADSGYDGLGTVTVSVESSGVDLPKLSNEGTASDLMLGKELIDSDGDIVVGTYVPLNTNDATAVSVDIVDGKTAYVNGQKLTGTNPYDKSTTDTKVDAQTSLIAQIKAALEGKTASGGGGAATPKLQEKSVTPTKSAQSVTPDSGFDGLSKVNVGAIPSDYIIPSGTKSITANGTVDVKNFASVSVNVPIPNGYIKPSGTLNVTQNGTYDVTEKTSVSVNVETESSGGGTSNNIDALIDRSITEISSNVAEVSGYVFMTCYDLTSANFPNATSIGYQAFNSCYSLTSINFPEVRTINGNAFTYCYALVSVDFPKVTSIGSRAFDSCSKLTSVILRSTSICTMATTNAFSNCSANLRIYVPANLVSSYKTATNWSTYADKIYSIEEIS